jgi:hypothetical protein
MHSFVERLAAAAAPTSRTSAEARPLVNAGAVDGVIT